MDSELLELLRKPMTWAVIYALAIPAFAMAYEWWPGVTLHDSNIQHEQAFAEEEDQRHAELASWIRAETTFSWPEQRTTVRPLTNTLEVRSITYSPQHGVLPSVREGAYIANTSDEGFLMEISGVNEYSIPGYSPTTSGFDFFVRVSAPVPITCSRTVAGRQVTTEYLRYTVNYAASPTTQLQGDAYVSGPVSLLFPGNWCGRTQFGYPHSSTGVLWLPVTMKEQLDHLFLAQTGDPSYHSRLLYRMLYLSATTITTLGLGDIAPVSERARLLVGLEAVFGIVVIGLFLNALAWQVSHPRS